MDLKNLLKLATPIGIGTIAVASIFLLLREIAAKDTFSKLTPEHTFYLYVLLIAVSSIIFFVAIAFTYKHYKPTRQKRTKKAPAKTYNKLALIGGCCIVLLLIVIGFWSFNKYSKKGNYHSVYREDFTKKSHEKVWRYGEQQAAISKILKNQLLLMSKSNNNIARRIDVEEHFDFDLVNHPSYRIELKVKMQEGESNAPFGLQWCGDSKQSVNYSFLINQKGQFIIQIFKLNNPIRTLVDWTLESTIKRDDFNVLTVILKENQWHFSINQKEVATLPKFDGFGNEIGFVTPSLSTIAIDWLELSQL